MDIEDRLKLITGIGEEVITPEELKALLETKAHPVAYDGFEPSGMAHLPVGVYRPLLLKDLLKAGVKFKLYVADYFAYLNDKMGGDMEKIKRVGEYFIEVWKAAGVDMKKVDVIWASDVLDDITYWEKVMRIAKNTSVARATRCLAIMDRKEGELSDTAQFFYPMMQCADVFHLGVDICQLGMGQRKVNMLARELGPKLGWWKPAVVSHHMLMGLEGPMAAKGFDEDAKIDASISSKMSKSKPDSCIYVHDSKEEIERKLKKAYCPEKVVFDNPILDYAKEIVFRACKEFKVERPAKFGGDVTYDCYAALESDFSAGKLHPLDLKTSTARYLDGMIAPIREHFEKDKKARELYESIRPQTAAK